MTVNGCPSTIGEIEQAAFQNYDRLVEDFK